LGTIDYQVIASYRLDQVFELRLDELKNPFAPLEARNDLRYVATNSDLTMDEICARHSVDLPSSFVRVAPQHAELIVKELTTAVRVCLVSERSSPDELLPCGPPAKAVQNWARQLKSEDRARFITEDRVQTLLELPPGTPDNPQSQRASRTGAAQYDAVEFLKWMRFTRHLHAQENVAEAADDALDAVLVHEVKQQVEAGRTRVPRKTALKEGRLHLDATDMLLERRYFKDMLTNRPDDLICVLFFSDGSPVSGTELQGMIMDLVMRCGGITTRILPGVAMAHGQFGVMSKAFALLWALYLIVGPWEYGLTLLLQKKTRGLTTDMGTELGLCDVPCLIKGFLLYLLGASMATIEKTVDFQSRLFCRAIRLAGWSHMFGGIMSKAAAPPSRPDPCTAKLPPNRVYIVFFSILAILTRLHLLTVLLV